MSLRTIADRRLLERRRKVVRERVRRRRRLLILLVGLGVLGYAAVQVSRSSLFGLSEVDVNGLVALDHSTVVAAAGVALGEPVLRLDLGAVRESVESLPRVEHAAVTRTPPSGLRIDITERAPAAAIANAGRFWLVAADGTVLGAAAGGRPTGLTYLAGVPSDPATLRPGFRFEADSAAVNAMTAYARLEPQLKRRVRGVTAETVEGLRFTLDDGAEVVYGAAERQGAKDAAALLLLRHAKAEGKEVGMVDVRAPSTPVLTTSTNTPQARGA